MNIIKESIPITVKELIEMLMRLPQDATVITCGNIGDAPVQSVQYLEKKEGVIIDNYQNEKDLENVVYINPDKE